MLWLLENVEKVTLFTLLAIPTFMLLGCLWLIRESDLNQSSYSSREDVKDNG
jgi:hypothetical protein